MIDNHFRAFLDGRVSLLVTCYQRVGLTPNQISIISFVIAICAAALCAGQMYVASGVVWWLGRLLDGTDGIYARATGQASPFGAYLDITCDMASYGVMILGFAYAFPDLSAAWLLILLLYILCITTALSLGSLEEKLRRPGQDNRGLRLGAGLAEGGETGLAYTAFLLWPTQVGWLAWLWVGVLLVTVVARTLLARMIFVSSAEQGQESSL